MDDEAAVSVMAAKLSRLVSAWQAMRMPVAGTGIANLKESAA
jgi:myo-inositol catabolism protein IolC